MCTLTDVQISDAADRCTKFFFSTSMHRFVHTNRCLMVSVLREESVHVQMQVYINRKFVLYYRCAKRLI